MELFTFALLFAVGAYVLKSKDESARIALLGQHLGNYQIEQLMETLSSGYLRALDGDTAERRAQIWQQMSGSELKLCEQFNRFVADFSHVDAADTRVSRLLVPFPYAAQLLPEASFDMRKLLYFTPKA
ncbi:hypothetical protein AwPolaro_10500 [Polaromonas sp.]|nr:hypothetical protein AwPolaro_10500 [Polaromonas sp.]